MKICLYRSSKDNSPINADIPWEKLKALLLEFEEREDKDGKAWSPVEIEEGETRGNKHVLSISCAVFDLDHLSQTQALDLNLRGTEYVLHSTFSYSCDDLSLRLILPLEKPFEKGNLSTAQYQAAWEGYRKVIVDRFKIPADPSCKDLSRLYFLPTSRPDRERVAEFDTGTRIALSATGGVDSGGVSPQPNQQKEVQQAERKEAPTSNGGESSQSALVDLDAVRKTLNSKVILKAALAGKPFAKAGERDTTLNKIASTVAWTLPELPVEAFLEVIAKSLIAVALEGEAGTDEGSPNHWIALAKAKFERAKETYKEKKEEEAAQLLELNKVFGEGVPIELAPDNEDWKNLLVYKKEDGEDTKTLQNSAGNAFLILKFSNEWRGAFRFNLVTRTIEITRGPVRKDTDPDVLPVVVRDWFEIHAPLAYRMNLRCDDVAQRIMTAALDNAYDPVKEYLDSLRWDGVKRLDNAPFTYFNALKEDEEGNDIEKHVQTVWRRWMVGAVARAYDPGCKMDTVLILESVQGQRKSTALSVLGEPWFTDAKFTIGDKDGSMIIGRAWICELAEMDNAKTTEPATHRAFFSRRTDTFRAPYGRSVRDWPRRCVFVGSINPDGSGYLADLTGNRRYWPIAVGLANTRSLSQDRNHLWAEAVAIYKAASVCEQCAEDEDRRCFEHRWWLNRDEEAVAEQQAELRTETDDSQNMIEVWWRKTPIAMRPHRITTSDLAVKLGYNLGQARSVQTRLGHALKKLGFIKRRMSGSGPGQRVYVPSQRFLDMPDTSGKTLAEVARA